MRWSGNWLRSREEKFADTLAARVGELGWTAGSVDGWSATYHGRDRGDREFQIRAIYGETSDELEWWGGTLRLDELVLAAANVSRSDRSWLRGVEISEGLAHQGLDPDALRDALNAKAAEGLAPAQLNEYALQLGAGGVDGVVTRFEATAVVVEPRVDGLQMLSLDSRLAGRLLTDDVRGRIASVAAQADFPAGAPTFSVFVGRPFSKIRLATRGTTIDLLGEIAELGSELRHRLTRTDGVES
jgi:hypothetical protein